MVEHRRFRKPSAFVLVPFPGLRSLPPQPGPGRELGWTIDKPVAGELDVTLARKMSVEIYTTFITVCIFSIFAVVQTVAKLKLIRFVKNQK